MKQFFLLIAICLTQTVQAQFLENNFIYFNTDVVVGNYRGANIGINYLHRGRISFQFGASGFMRGAPNTPFDFDGVFRPPQTIAYYFFKSGSVFNLSEDGNVRLNLMVGAGLGKTSKPVNFVRETEVFFIEYETYTHDREVKRTFDVIMEPKIEFLISRGYGISISGLVSFGEAETAVGLSVGQMFGVIRKR